MRYRSRRRHGKMIEDLPLTPLIDTALTLLVIFMISSPMIHHAIKIQLPQGKANESNSQEQSIIVYIDKDQAVYLNEKRMDLSLLLEHIAGDQLIKNNGTVYVRADQAVNYGRVIEVVDALKVTGGVRYVALATKKYA